MCTLMSSAPGNDRWAWLVLHATHATFCSRNANSENEKCAKIRLNCSSCNCQWGNSSRRRRSVVEGVGSKCIIAVLQSLDWIWTGAACSMVRPGNLIESFPIVIANAAGVGTDERMTDWLAKSPSIHPFVRVGNKSHLAKKETKRLNQPQQTIICQPALELASALCRVTVTHLLPLVAATTKPSLFCDYCGHWKLH